MVVVDTRTIDCPEIGREFVSGEVQPDLEDEFVDLGVQFCPEERHKIIKYIDRYLSRKVLKYL